MFTKSLSFLPIKVSALFEGAYNEKIFLSFFRIAISFIAIFDLLSMLADFPLFFSKSKTVIPQELIYITSEYFLRFQSFFGFLDKYNLETVFYSVIPWFYMSSLIFLLLGLFSRFSALIALISQLLIFRSFVSFNYGYDHFLTMSLFYCFVFPVGKYYSLDNKIFKKRIPANFNYQRVIQIHLCMVYFFSGMAKVIDISWWNGNSMWKVVASVFNSQYKIYPLILMLVGIGVVLLETFYAFFVYKKFSRKIVISLAILMHISIGIMMELYSFAAILIVWNIAAFSNFTYLKSGNESNV